MPNESGCVLGNCSSSYKDCAVNRVVVLKYVGCLFLREQGEAEVNRKKAKAAGTQT